MKRQRKTRRRTRRRTRMRTRRRRRTRCVRIRRSTRKHKKYMADTGACIVHFGDDRYSDYTKHKDPRRKSHYIKRHKKRERWGKSGLCTAGFWSRHLLWGEPTLAASKRVMSTRFGIKIC